ncbi:hypothetical protein ACP0FW_27165, partial [Escherichia coli]|uniref:hypothetical protein n=1 Tax=Escherichia coli TaxID=562 RepID=UPI003CF3D0C2
YPVSVIRSPAGEARAMTSLPLDQAALAERLRAVENAVFRGTRSAPGATPPALPIDFQEFGRVLYETLFPGPVRNRYIVSREK